MILNLIFVSLLLSALTDGGVEREKKMSRVEPVNTTYGGQVVW